MLKKRIFDIFFSVTGLVLAFGLIALLYIIAAVDTGKNGFFLQKSIGRHGHPFTIIKIRSVKQKEGGSPFITPFGAFIRKYKLDELPQFINILLGSMSFVGPRPDVPGYYDTLTGADAAVLNLKPGITGPASIKYAREEQLLLSQDDPQAYNDKVIFPDKVRINLNYLKHWSLLLDVKIIAYTLIGKKLEEEYFN
jgi:lipopolysaccharide/colanic/teichoic acid biosynthesis glycosyltransferase